MTWERLQKTTYRKPVMADDEVLVSVIRTNGAANGKSPSVAITFGRTVAEELGIEPARVHVDRGHDTFHGIVRVESHKSGTRKVGRLPGDKHGRLRLVVPGEFLGVTTKHEAETVKARREPSGALLITLPKWARRYGERATKS